MNNFENLEKTLENLKNLEDSIYSILDNYEENIQKIVNEIKEKFFSKIENIEHKLQLSIIVEEAIANYFANLLRSDFLEFVVEDLRKKEKIN